IVTNSSQVATSTAVVVRPVAPGLFTRNGSGHGAPAGQILCVHADGTQDAPQDVAVFDRSQAQWAPAPVSLGGPSDTAYLVLYGTGIRHYNQKPVASVGDQPIPVAFAGAQATFPGLDQVNLILPRSLIGAGTVDVSLTVDGVVSNTVLLAFQ